jgi:hypothetical protein
MANTFTPGQIRTTVRLHFDTCTSNEQHFLFHNFLFDVPNPNNSKPVLTEIFIIWIH